MPAPETSHRYQASVLWAFSGYGADGEPTVSDTPVEIRVRGGANLRRMTDPKGNTIIFDASMCVDRDIVTGGVMWMGALADWNAALDNELMEVKLFKSTPDLKNRFTEREVGLMRYRGALP